MQQSGWLGVSNIIRDFTAVTFSVKLGAINNTLAYLLLNCSNHLLIHDVITQSSSAHPPVPVCHMLSSFIFIFVFLINCMLMSKVLNKISKTLHENIFSLHTDRTSEKGPWNLQSLSVNFPLNLTFSKSRRDISRISPWIILVPSNW